MKQPDMPSSLNGWRTVSLRDIATHFADGPFGSNLKSEHYVKDGIRVIRLQNIGVGRMLHDDLAFISREHYESLPRNHCKPGDVIIGTLGDPNLRACIVPDDLPESLNKADCLLFRADRRLADPAYICAVLNADRIVKMASGLIRGQTRGRISMGRLEKLPLPLPPLGEQKRIATILDTADALRAKRRETLSQLDTLLQSAFRDMFGDPDANPKRWKEHHLGKLAAGTFRNGLSPSNSGTLDGVVLTLSAITGGAFDFSARKAARFDRAPDSSQLLSTDTFLICRGNGNKHLVGTGAFPDRSCATVCFPDTMIGVRVDAQRVKRAYLESVWMSPRVRRQIEKGARTTNGTFKVNQQVLASILIPIPPIEVQTRFAMVVESIDGQRAQQRAHLAELDTLSASLQARAFSGQL